MTNKLDDKTLSAELNDDEFEMTNKLDNDNLSAELDDDEFEMTNNDTLLAVFKVSLHGIKWKLSGMVLRVQS